MTRNYLLYLHLADGSPRAYGAKVDAPLKGPAPDSPPNPALFVARIVPVSGDGRFGRGRDDGEILSELDSIHAHCVACTALRILHDPKPPPFPDALAACPSRGCWLYPYRFGEAPEIAHARGLRVA